MTEGSPSTEEAPGATSRGAPGSVPLWVKLVAVAAALVVALVVALMLIGGGEHGPDRHLGGGEDGSPAAVGDDGPLPADGELEGHEPPPGVDHGAEQP